MDDVTDYGAAGDGETVDTAAIRDAVDAAGDAGGGIVRLPAGEYRVDGPVTMRSRVRLVGDGMGATTVAAEGTGFAPLQYLGDADDVLVDATVADLTVDSSGLGDPDDYSAAEKCVYYQHVRRCQILRVHAYGAAATGIGTDMMVDSLVHGCVAENCGRNFAAARDGLNLGSNGIGIGTGLQDDAEPVVVSDCHARANGNNGIMFENQATGGRANEYHAGHVFVHGSTAVGNRVGFRTSADRRVRVSNCSAHANDEDGVVIDEKGDWPNEAKRPPFPAREHRVDGCHVTENGGHGVHVADAGTDAFVDVADCHVGANAGAGVRVSTGEPVRSVSVADCEVYDNGGPGLTFADGGADLRVSDCDVRDNGRSGPPDSNPDGADSDAAGVHFGGPVEGSTVAGCHVVDRAGTQSPGVAVAADHESLVVRDNQFRGDADPVAGETLPVVRENEGFVTEQAGFANARGDGERRRFSVEHGLDVAPLVTSAWAASDDAVGRFHVTDGDADEFAVVYETAPADGAALRWGFEARR
ncbi:right-handed parallel beta-helix repeat-containing protein [Halosimplex amylolyticum]|uniref:right-handed parallel beta-helix repeat-containing protein n=1 Tax=Halosimplex amylolyticum TaxID=3396616 RepID=UPI003F557E4C